MSDTKKVLASIEDLRQYARDLNRYGEDKALMLLFVRVNYERHNLTIADLAAAIGMRDDDAYDCIKDLIFERRLNWSVISGSDRMQSRVRAA